MRPPARLELWLTLGLAACAQTPHPETSVPKPSVPRADVVFVGGIVHTLEPTESTPKSAIAIREGKVLASGTDAEVSKFLGPSTKVIGLAGRTLVPGLVDAHMHLQSLGQRRNFVDLVGTTSIEEVREKITAAVRSASAGQWVVGRGWDQNDWSGKQKGQFPTAKDLDKVSTEVPIVLTRIDGHASWVNSKALSLAGIDKSTSAPSGGQILKKGGQPTGILIDNAMNLVSGQIPAPTKPELKKAYRIAQDECLKAGLTGVHDMGIGPSELEALEELDAAGELRLRVYALLDGGYDQLHKLLEKGPRIATENQRLTVRGVKFFADGALGSRGALLHEPYSDDSSTSGLTVTDLDFLEARARSVKEAGFQPAVHAIGDRANSVVLDIFERIYGGPSQGRPRVEHAQLISMGDLPRFGTLGVVASMQPVHATSDMPWAEARVGPNRIRGGYAWHSLLSQNAVIAAGSDAPVEEISVLAGLYAAMTRQDASGQPEGGWLPEERMTPVEALSAFTRGAAYAAFQEKELGTLASGFTADLTVIDIDPLGEDHRALLSARAELVMIGGQIAWARPGADAPPKAPEPKSTPLPAPKATATSTSAPSGDH